VSIIFTYAPTRDSNETIEDVFFGKLQQLTSSIAAGDYLIVAGDFNARGGQSDRPQDKSLENLDRVTDARMGR